MLLNCKQCDKNVNEWFMHYIVCLFSLVNFKMVLMAWMLVQMKVYFSLLFDEWHIRMPKLVTECWLKCTNKHFLSLLNVFVRNCSPFHANECVFSYNVQQKV